MSLQIHDRSIHKVCLIDDDSDSRETLAFPVEELELEFELEEGPIEDMDIYVNDLYGRSQAAICDHHLKKKGKYSNYNGAELVFRLYQDNFPAILCTSYSDRIEELRRYRRNIPVLLNPSELNVDSVAHGLELCINEMRGDIREDRKPWRTLIRVQDLDTQVNPENPYVEFVVPAWDHNYVVRVLLSDIPGSLQKKIEPDYRCYAKVNIGAESSDDLFIDEWEDR